MLNFEEIIPSRQLNILLIILDIIFLVVLIGLLIYKKKYLTVLFALAGGILYFIVDYGIFFHALGIRKITGADPAWFLLWLSMSYGITNFAWIWLAIKKDDHLKEWTLLIFIWWLASPLISQNFGGPNTIEISRGTGQYHGFMAIILLVGYLSVIVYNLYVEKNQRLPLFRMFAVGFLVQSGWEFALLVAGVRAPNVGP